MKGGPAHDIADVLPHTSSRRFALVGRSSRQPPNRHG
jgi:hypothetical protein